MAAVGAVEQSCQLRQFVDADWSRRACCSIGGFTPCGFLLRVWVFPPCQSQQGKQFHLAFISWVETFSMIVCLLTYRRSRWWITSWAYQIPCSGIQRLSFVKQLIVLIIMESDVFFVFLFIWRWQNLKRNRGHYASCTAYLGPKPVRCSIQIFETLIYTCLIWIQI